MEQDPRDGRPGEAPDDSGSFVWAVLGFFIPLVGLILWLAWRKTKPLSAARAGEGALVGLGVSLILNGLVTLL